MPGAEGAPPEVAKQVCDLNLCSGVLLPSRNADLEGRCRLFKEPLVLTDVMAKLPPWAFPSPGAQYSFSNGVLFSVASGNTQGHVIWPCLEGLPHHKAALGRRGDCFFPARCSFTSPVGKERLFGCIWHRLGANHCCWRGCREGTNRGRETAALSSVS